MKIRKPRNIFSVFSLPKYLLIWVLAVSAVFSIFFYYQLSELYTQNINSAKGEVRRLVKIVAGNTALSFISVDRTLRRTEERYYFNSLFGQTLTDDLEHNLKLWVNETPLLDALLLVDESGTVQAVSKKAFSKLDIQKNDVFSVNDHMKHHKSLDNENVYITPLQEGGSRSHHRIIISRPLKQLDGKFGGLVIAIMNGYSLTDFFQSIEVGNDTQLAILLNHYELLVNNSGFEPDVTSLRAVIKENEFDDDFNNLTRLIEIKKDDAISLYAYKKIAGLPISIGVVMNQDDILGSWYQTRENYFIFLSIFLSFTVTVLFFLYILGKKIRQVKKSENTAILASQAKSDFLAKMSHELRTPLNAIIGFSDMLKAGYFGELTQAQIERINDINMCGNHLLGFINDILEFSKGDAGKMQLEESPFYLSEVVNQSIRMISQRARTNDIRLINHTDKYVVQLYADPRKLKQVLINLLSNAVKFTPSGGSITLSSGINEQGNFYFSIEDTGVGIPKEDIPKAMSVFEQVHNSNDFEGTGLGLPLCKMLIELHGGTFLLESEVAKGTKATFTLTKESILSYTVTKQRAMQSVQG